MFIVIGGGMTFSIYKLWLYYSINLNYSVLQTQKTIERLKYYERLDKNLLYAVIPVFSTAFLIVMAKAVLNFDLYVLGGWLMVYTGGSFIVGFVVVFILKKFPNKGMQKALMFLIEIKELETK
jgi:hypothetical protein